MQLVFIGTHNECVDTIMCTCNRDKSHIRPYDSEFVIIDICLCKHFVLFFKWRYCNWSTKLAISNQETMECLCASRLDISVATIESTV